VKRILRKGFDEEFVAPRIARALDLAAGRIGRHGNDGDVRRNAADTPRSLQAVHHRHADVHQHGIGLHRPEHVHGLGSRMGTHEAEAAAEDGFDESEIGVRILGDQQYPRLAVVPARGGAMLLVVFAAVPVDDGDREMEPRALPGFGIHADRTVEFLDDHLRNGQPEPSSGCEIVEFDEPVENIARLLGRYAHAGILDEKLHASVLQVEPEADLPLFGKLAGVVQ